MSASAVAILRQQPPAAFLVAQKVVFYYVCWRYASRIYRHLWSRGPINTIIDGYNAIVKIGFGCIMRWPSVKARVDRELALTRIELQEKLAPALPHIQRNLALPDAGCSAEWIHDELDKLASIQSTDWKAGKVSGAVYYGDEGEAASVMQSALVKFLLSNPLHPDVFPGVRIMEAQLVQMILDMYNAPPGAGGTTTSGGTESILMACKTYREWGAATKGITEPEIVLPVSAHAAFNKAASYFGIKLRTIPVNKETRQVDIKAVKRAINGNTVALVGSAPNFPDGAIDDIAALSALAKRHKIGLHVDCCLGSFIVPFLEAAGFETVPFDFRLEGVTSISCDPHKYGFTCKGISTVLYRTTELRSYQYFVTAEWPGGVYASPSIAGSRPGSLIAGAWATLMNMGRSGYIESCKSIVGATKQIESLLCSDVPEVYILGRPLASVVAFGSNVVDILEVGDRLGKKGWHCKLSPISWAVIGADSRALVNALQDPPALHICVTRLTVPRVDELVNDVKQAVRDVLANPESSKGDMTMIYGLGNGTPVGPQLVTRVAKMFIDTLYHV